MPRRLILVDDLDRPLGFASKKVCHTGKGRRHRAYLVLILNRKGFEIILLAILIYSHLVSTPRLWIQQLTD